MIKYIRHAGVRAMEKYIYMYMYFFLDETPLNLVLYSVMNYVISYILIRSNKKLCNSSASNCKM